MNIHPNETIVSDLESPRGDEWVEKIAEALMDKMENREGILTMIREGVANNLAASIQIGEMLPSLAKPSDPAPTNVTGDYPDIRSYA